MVSYSNQPFAKMISDAAGIAPLTYAARRFLSDLPIYIYIYTYIEIYVIFYTSRAGERLNFRGSLMWVTVIVHTKIPQTKIL